MRQTKMHSNKHTWTMVKLVCKLGSFTWAKINIVKMVNLFNIKWFGKFNRNPCKGKAFS
jgi:hypothetical protein